mgnify:CR=1 FL=1
MASVILEGDYKGQVFITKSTFKGEKLMMSMPGFLTQPVEVNKDLIEDYEVLTEEHRKSAASGVGRGLVGGALLGPVGLLAGALSAKNKGKYNVVLQFKDGKKSLAELDEKHYKLLLRCMF